MYPTQKMAALGLTYAYMVANVANRVLLASQLISSASAESRGCPLLGNISISTSLPLPFNARIIVVLRLRGRDSLIHLPAQQEYWGFNGINVRNGRCPLMLLKDVRGDN